MGSTSLNLFKHREAKGNSAEGWFYENVEKQLCWLKSSRDWPVDQSFGIPVRQNLAGGPRMQLSKIVWESGICVLSKGLVQGANCFPSDKSLSEINLLVNFSGIHSQQCHLFTIVLPSDHLPSVSDPLLSTPTAS